MLVVRLTEKEFEDLNELYIQIKTIQNLHDGKVFNKSGLFILEFKVMEHLCIFKNQEELDQNIEKHDDNKWLLQ
jgi:chemotaxis protein CheY-P-specific phosphatase CheC